MRLELDAGNTRIKWRVWHDGDIILRGADLKSDINWQQPLPEWIAQLDSVWVSSVHKEQDDWIAAQFPQAEFAQCKSVHGQLKNSYSDPLRMGVDRWLAMLAVWDQQPGHGHIVVDAGTAITMDIISQDGQHVGGYICPGVSMMKNNLLLGTSKILANQQWLEGRLPGKYTQQCVDHGIQDMVASWVENCCKQYPEAMLWISGGDGQWLAALLSSKNIVNPDLVLDGLKISFQKI